jgi:hypothetical protein
MRPPGWAPVTALCIAAAAAVAGLVLTRDRAPAPEALLRGKGGPP